MTSTLPPHKDGITTKLTIVSNSMRTLLIETFEGNCGLWCYGFLIDDLNTALAEVFLLCNEGTIKDFLGVCFYFATHPTSPKGPKLMAMTQTSLINSILNEVGLVQSPDYTPANDSPL
jgi:hypothetical protein